MTTTPNEFLQFAKEMGLGRIKSSSSSSILPIENNNGYSLTGLSVLNNLCHLIEHIHTLKAENDHLRAHLELMNHVEKFLVKNNENKLIDQKQKLRIHSTTSVLAESTYDDDKSLKLSPSSSLKMNKRRSPSPSISSRDRLGIDMINSHQYSSSMLQIDHEQSEMMDSNSTLGLSPLPTWQNWNKVRHALKFSLRRKNTSPNTSLVMNTERQIPAISISFDSDDDHLSENKRLKKKKKKSLISINRQGEESDQDDESNEFIRIHHKRKTYGNDTNSSSNERQETSTSHLPYTSLTVDDDTLLTRKQSKIAHYRHKLRSKLDTVKRQFSDQNSSSSLRLFPNTHGSTFDDIGSGANHALLTAKLAPAMTKSYQQKMREWETMQKSNFLVNYRRQSVVNKIELNNNSQKASIISAINEASVEKIISSSSSSSSSIDTSTIELEGNLSTHGPILSPNQRSLIVHQWREIMSEEISLRHYNEYLERKMLELKQLETDLKSLKTNIFSTNNRDYSIKHQSMMNIEHDLLDHQRQSDLPQRCRSVQSLVSMPASWILAVQSAAYSDVLDGTSNKTTDRAILFNKDFFNQLKHFKNGRHHFEQDTMKNLQGIKNLKPNVSYEENLNEKRPIRPCNKVILSRGCLHKLSYIVPSEIPQHVSSSPMIPFQTAISKLGTYSPIDRLPTPTTSEPEPSLQSSSSTTLHKRSKRTRFDFKKTLQRSKSMCMTQFNSWLQRRRQAHPSIPRRKSAVDPKTVSSPCSTPKLLGSPRLARLHQRIFKPQASPSSSMPSSEPTSLPSILHTELSSFPVSFPRELPLLSSVLLDDSDQQFQQREHSVRIYLPARTPPTTRHVRINETNILNDYNMPSPPMSKITSPIINRRNLPSSIKTTTTTTARERRESYAAMSNIYINK